MNTVLLIKTEEGEHVVQPEDFPVSLYLSKNGAVQVNVDESSSVVWLDASDGRLFLQTTESGKGVLINQKKPPTAVFISIF